MRIFDSIVDTIGDTPLVRLRRISEREGLSCTLALKMESFNPGGSAKDRPALEMVLAAERDGLLRPGGTIVEPTSGNTGVGLAIVAAQRGYRCVFVVSDKVAPEKISLLRAYGAEVVVCPVAVPPDHPDSYYSVAERLTVERGAFRPNQYANPNNPLAHEKTTGPEIWEQTGGAITHFVAGAGTSGSITGVARHLKRMNPAVKVLAADPERSVFSGGDGRPYLVEGVGEDFFPAAWDPALYDEVVPISDAEAFAVARRVSREEGILLGGSGGLAVAAALRVARLAPPEAVIVVLNPDSGRGYLSRVFDDQWMASRGFDIGVPATGTTVGAVVEAVAAPFVSVPPDATVEQALDVLDASHLPAVPVCAGPPPFALAELGASFGFSDVSDAGPSGALVDGCLGSALPFVGVHEPVSVARASLLTAPACVVVDQGVPVAVLSQRHLSLFAAKQVRS